MNCERVSASFHDSLVSCNARLAALRMISNLAPPHRTWHNRGWSDAESVRSLLRIYLVFRPGSFDPPVCCMHCQARAAIAYDCHSCSQWCGPCATLNRNGPQPLWLAEECEFVISREARPAALSASVENVQKPNANVQLQGSQQERAQRASLVALSAATYV